MNLRFIVASILSLWFISGCTYYQASDVDRQIDQLQGLSPDAMIALLGVPNKQIKTEQQQHLEWLFSERSQSSSRVSVGGGGGGGHWFSAIGISIPLNSEPETCLIRASFAHQQPLSNVTWEGDANYCGARLKQLLQS
ncbi:MAG: hypothetical protein HWE11_12470 [Gammaproteobacteria bacterium]|nr:hypothetical protein [Gammaproteobacteria bacterium]